ncbi:MAG: metallophosphoesterase [Candidatus Micrarchaeota archaeon]|nr:metallophosphoesterase [Candidatus Micrarchaeota archaeon]
MSLRFVYDQPAALLADALLLSDLHLGIEYELQQKGYHIPLQYKSVAADVNALLKETRARQIVFLGDVKHDVYGMRDPEERMLANFFRLLKTRRITVCKGNHDSKIEDLKGIMVAPPEGMLLEKTLLFHGHALPSEALLEKADAFCCGHEHPLAQIKEGKHIWTQKAWILGRQNGKRFTVFPHFGRLIGGRVFDAQKHLVRFLSANACRKADVRLLSGVRLGRVGGKPAKERLF